MRVKIELPNQFLPGNYSIPIRISDINYGNHTGNDAIVSILHESRMQWLKQYNYNELNIEGAGLIMADLAIEFKNQTYYGEVVNVQLAVAGISKVSFELYYNLTVIRNVNEVLAAKAKTGMVCYNYEQKKIVPIPEALQQILMDNHLSTTRFSS